MKLPQQKLIFTFKGLLDYFFYKSILARYVHDQSVIPLFSSLTGKVLEIGAGVHDYSEYAVNCDEYIRSDYRVSGKDDRIVIDATAITLDDNSIDSVVCMSSLEHIENYGVAISEIQRILKPGGKLLLNTPWLFPFHGAPDDYFRFSSSALSELLRKDFEKLSFNAVGNYWVSLAVFLQRPMWSRNPVNDKNRWFDIPLRLLGIVFYMVGCRVSHNTVDDNYSLLYSMLYIKKNNSIDKGQC